MTVMGLVHVLVVDKIKICGAVILRFVLCECAARCHTLRVDRGVGTAR
jgi:hypothetical protein